MKATTKPRVRWILDVFASNRDRNGNRYMYAELTSTVTGKYVMFNTHAACNARKAVVDAMRKLDRRKHDLYFESIHEVESPGLGVRDVQSTRRTIKNDESFITPALLRELEERE